MARLIGGALGEVKADLIVSGGKLINVYSGELLEGFEIAALDGRICYVGSSAKHCHGDETAMLDAAGCYISPGFIDGQVLEKLEFPFGGIFSLQPWREVGEGMARMQARLKQMGSSFDKPVFALNFLPFVTLPALRITARGLVNVKERRIVPLFAD